MLLRATVFFVSFVQKKRFEQWFCFLREDLLRSGVLREKSASCSKQNCFFVILSNSCVEWKSSFFSA